jgi:hypothetical protein
VGGWPAVPGQVKDVFTSAAATSATTSDRPRPPPEPTPTPQKRFPTTSPTRSPAPPLRNCCWSCDGASSAPASDVRRCGTTGMALTRKAAGRRSARNPARTARRGTDPDKAAAHDRSRPKQAPHRPWFMAGCRPQREDGDPRRSKTPARLPKASTRARDPLTLPLTGPLTTRGS